MDGRPQRPPERWEDRPGGDLLGAGPGEQDGHGHPRPPEVLRAGGRWGRARGRVCAGVCVWRPGVGPKGCLGGCHRGPCCAGVRMCAIMGLWQERCPMRCSWTSGGCGELGVLFGSFSGKGVMSRPATPGVGERVKWPGGAGALVNLSEAHTTFVLACGVCVTCLYCYFFVFFVCVFGYVCGYVFNIFQSTRYLGIFGSLSVCTCPLKPHHLCSVSGFVVVRVFMCTFLCEYGWICLFLYCIRVYLCVWICGVLDVGFYIVYLYDCVYVCVLCESVRFLCIVCLDIVCVCVCDLFVLCL